MAPCVRVETVCIFLLENVKNLLIDLPIDESRETEITDNEDLPLEDIVVERGT